MGEACTTQSPRSIKQFWVFLGPPFVFRISFLNKKNENKFIINDFYVLVLTGVICRLSTTFENEENKVLFFIVCFFCFIFAVVSNLGASHQCGDGGGGHTYSRKLY